MYGVYACLLSLPLPPSLGGVGGLTLMLGVFLALQLFFLDWGSLLLVPDLTTYGYFN